MNKAFRYVILFTLISGAMCSSILGFIFPEGLAKVRANLLEQEEKTMQKFSKLFDVLGIEHDGTLDSIVQATQREWLRPAGKERWDAPDKHEDKRAQVLAILDQLGYLQEIHASKKRYNRAIILGALASRVRSRLAHFLKQWKAGVRFDEIVVLGGERPLHPKLESHQVLLDRNNKELPIRADWTLQGELPETESGMIRMVFDQADLPEKLKKEVRIVFVETPMQQRPDGSLRRPNTGDTIIHWKRTCAPTPGSCLVISSQPYVCYQDAVARTFLSKYFGVETIGSCVQDDLPLAVHLDNIARWLYQERQRLYEYYERTIMCA